MIQSSARKFMGESNSCPLKLFNLHAFYLNKYGSLWRQASHSEADPSSFGIRPWTLKELESGVKSTNSIAKKSTQMELTLGEVF